MNNTASAKDRLVRPLLSPVHDPEQQRRQHRRMGPSHTLRCYWAIDGTRTWHPETVAGKGSVR